MNRLFRYFNVFTHLNIKPLSRYKNNVSQYSFLVQYFKKPHLINQSYFNNWRRHDYKNKFKNAAIFATGCGVIFALCDNSIQKDDKLFFRSAYLGDVKTVQAYVYLV